MTAPTTPVLRRRLTRGRIILISIVVVLAILATSLSSIAGRWLRDAQGQPAVVGATTIAVTDDWFEPPVSEVPVGTTVTFVWDGNAAHDVVFDDGIGSEIVTSGSYERHFDTPGAYRFRCTVHPFMEGRIDVAGPA